MGDRKSSVTKLRVGGCKEDVLEWFNNTRQAPIPDAKLAARVVSRGQTFQVGSSHARDYCQGDCIDVSPVLRQGQPDSGESCITLESRPTGAYIFFGRTFDLVSGRQCISTPSVFTAL